MPRYPTAVCWALLGLCLASAARAETPADPLRLVPEQADLFLKIENPRGLLEGLLASDLARKGQEFDAVQEYFESTNYRRFYQLVRFFEKKLEMRWPDLLDKVAGGGVVVAAKTGANPAPTLLLIQSKDEATLRQFVATAREVLDQELARQDLANVLEKESHRDVETLHVGKDVHIAVAGSALLISNKPEILNLAIDRHLDGGKNSLVNKAAVVEARKLVPANALAWVWFDLATAHNAPQAKEIFVLPRNDANLTVLFGSYLDIIGRAPFVIATVTPDKGGFTTAIRLPAGREGMAEALALHVPMSDKEGSLPLLEPKGVLYSSTFYFDLSQIWEKRDKLFNEKQVKDLEKFDKDSGRFLSGLQFSKIAAQTGTHYRLVAAEQRNTGYTRAPNTRIPAFAIATDMRDAEDFPKMMNTVLRGAGFLASTQVKIKLVEEKHGDVTLVGYRFPEDGKFPQDVENIRFNFSPCFATVGDQFFVASTLELGHELVDLLEKEAKDGVTKHPAAVRDRLYGSGLADLLTKQEDQLMVQTILAQALPPAEAKEQVAKFIALVRQLGVLELETTYEPREFRYEIRYRPSK